jgi:hypothetical protein
MTMSPEEIARAPYIEQAKKMLLEYAADNINDLADSLFTIAKTKEAGGTSEEFLAELRLALKRNLLEGLDYLNVSPEAMFEVSTFEHYRKHPEDYARAKPVCEADHRKA